MLTCQEVTAKASLMVDGELGFRERMGVLMHLMTCANCRRFTRQFKALVFSMASRRGDLQTRLQLQLGPPGNRLESEAISSEFVNRVMRSLESAQAPFSDSRGPDRE